MLWTLKRYGKIRKTNDKSKEIIRVVANQSDIYDFAKFAVLVFEILVNKGTVRKASYFSNIRTTILSGVG